MDAKTTSKNKSGLKPKMHPGGRKTLGDIIFDTVNGIILTLFMIAMLYPLINTVAISFNDGTDALRGGIYLVPRMFTWDNYKTVLSKPHMLTAAKIFRCGSYHWRRKGINV